MRAVRAAIQEADNDNVRRRLMIVPNCHVMRLETQPSGGARKVIGVQTNLGTVPLADGGAVVIALATVESTRLALNSFQGVPHFALIGRNLMAHLRSNVDISQKVPDIDGFEPFKNITDSHVVITIRGIGEMEPFDPDNPNVQTNRVRPDPDPDEFGVPRAFVELHPTDNDLQLWTAMDQTSDDVAKLFAGGLPFEVFTPLGQAYENSRGEQQRHRPCAVY